MKDQRLKARDLLNKINSNNKDILRLKEVIDLMHPYIYMDDDIDFKIKQIEEISQKEKKVGKK